MPGDKVDMSIHMHCEICDINPASEIKGGINFITKERGLWFCCKECCQRIEDERTKDRRSFKLGDSNEANKDRK